MIKYFGSCKENAYNGQGFVQVRNSMSPLPEPSAECKIKKLIIYSSAGTIADSEL
jgi:hypothetical protein